MGTTGALLGDGKPNRLAGMANDMRRAGSSAPLLTFCPGTFSAAGLGCGRTFLTAVFALASLVVLSNSNALAQGSVAEDRAALVTLYNATDGPNWTDNTNWLSNEALSAWHGVTTDADGRVTDLLFYDNQLTGTIPTQLGQLTELQYLNLNNNELSGTIPTELRRLTKLTGLDLGNNRLTGTIPTQLGQLTELRYLNLPRQSVDRNDPDPVGTTDQAHSPVSR